MTQHGLGGAPDTTHANFGRVGGGGVGLPFRSWLSHQTRIYHRQLRNRTWDCTTSHANSLLNVFQLRISS